ncbi:MAG: hypothetical protein KJZ83_06915 [Burkholderiaceae bacterium]|nr:hypothetical protein [Burkholderiaceae bacterium]
MTLHEILMAMGIDPSVLYAGAGGGALRALSRKKIKFREVFVSPVCGALASAYLTIPAVQYVKMSGWPFPQDDAQVVLASAFLIGTCAMWIADLVLGFIVRRMGLSQEPPP